MNPYAKILIKDSTIEKNYVDELKTFNSLVIEVGGFIKSPIIPEKEKIDIIKSLKFSEILEKIIIIAIKEKDFEFLFSINKDYKNLIEKELKIKVAKLIISSEGLRKQSDEIIEKVKKSFDVEKIIVDEIIVDEELIAGFKISTTEAEYEYNIKNELKKLKEVAYE